ncbi:MAG: GMC family oxidoreductase N-terminal domain-containing protein, partial [Myxococcota bacterium]
MLGTHANLSSASTLRDGAVLRAEAVVIGLGAGGAMVFHDLAKAGRDVLALEFGGVHEAPDMARREELMLPQLFMEGASRATDDLAIRVLQGKGVGGSTLHNTNLCRALPHELRDQWIEDYGVTTLRDGLAEDFVAVERLLGVHAVPDEKVNANNALVQRGLDALGWRGGRMAHNRAGCKGSGFCELGCPNDGKQNAAKVLVPGGLDAGGRVLTHARADRIVEDAGSVCAVEAVAVDPDSGRDAARFTVHAERVILSASATNSAAIALRSELPNPHGLTGTNLHMHPGAYVGGLFEERVDSWFGVPQSVECTEYLEFTREATRRAWILAGAAHPGAVAGLMPGFGVVHGRDMRRAPHLGVL